MQSGEISDARHDAGRRCHPRDTILRGLAINPRRSTQYVPSPTSA